MSEEEKESEDKKKIEICPRCGAEMDLLNNGVWDCSACGMEVKPADGE